MAKISDSAPSVHDSNIKLDDLGMEESKLNSEISDLERRVNSTEQEILKTTESLSNLRISRSRTLAECGDASELSGNITVTQNNRELLEDEIIGIKALILDKKKRLKDVLSEIKQVRFDIAKRKYFELLDKYNVEAEKMGVLITELYTAQNEYSRTGHRVLMNYPTVYTERHLNRSGDIFQAIPKVSLKNEEEYFWNLWNWSRKNH